MNPSHLVETGRKPDHLAGAIVADHYWSVGLSTLSTARRSVATPSAETQPSCPLSRIAVLKALRPPQAAWRCLGRIAVVLGLAALAGHANNELLNSFSQENNVFTISSSNHEFGNFGKQIADCEVPSNTVRHFFVDDLRIGRTSFDAGPGLFLTSISGAPNGVVSLNSAGVPTIHHLDTAPTRMLAERQAADLPMVQS